MSKEYDDELPEVPPVSLVQEPALPSKEPLEWERSMSEKEICNYKEKSNVDNRNSNQNLARRLVMTLMIAMAVVFAVSYVIELFLKKQPAVSAPSGMAEKLLPILQSALFTMLGYLFGKKDQD